MTAERTLVAGIGNIFLGDDGLGCEVVRRLSQADLPAGVRVVDYGIRGLHLAYDLLDGCDRLVLVDALPERGAPGHLEVLVADVSERMGLSPAVAQAVPGAVDAVRMLLAQWHPAARTQEVG